MGLLSCEKATVEPINPSAISYNKNVQPIIEAHCIECHLMGSESAELFDYDHVAATVVSGQLEGCFKRRYKLCSNANGSCFR